MTCGADNSKILIYQGDTFAPSMTVTLSGAAVDLTSYTIAAFVNDFSGNSIAVLTPVKLDQTTNIGQWTVNADTTNWPIGPLSFFISYTFNGIKNTSETEIQVLSGV